jgi:ADP-heptose:LPS heptosyltransferase
MPEWVSNMRLVIDEGYRAEIPDVFEWCADVNRTVRWDVGIVPGCKGGDWLRKRWDGMATASRMLVQLGYKVGVFGQPDDGVRGMAGEWVQTPRIEMVPDALAGCRVILGTDSGLTQLAASLGVPVVAVFTATSAIKGLPMGHNNTILQTTLECQPCQSTVMWHACRNWRCQAIEPAAAVQAVRETLGD